MAKEYSGKILALDQRLKANLKQWKQEHPGEIVLLIGEEVSFHQDFCPVFERIYAPKSIGAYIAQRL